MNSLSLASEFVLTARIRNQVLRNCLSSSWVSTPILFAVVSSYFSRNGIWGDFSAVPMLSSDWSGIANWIKFTYPSTNHGTQLKVKFRAPSILTHFDVCCFPLDSLVLIFMGDFLAKSWDSWLLILFKNDRTIIELFSIYWQCVRVSRLRSVVPSSSARFRVNNRIAKFSRHITTNRSVSSGPNNPPAFSSATSHEYEIDSKFSWLFSLPESPNVNDLNLMQISQIPV